jgi:hypothetical protein
LPYLASADSDPSLRSLYDWYDFAEPWDGPNNRKLAPLMPRVFGCPNDPDWRKSNAGYLLITGLGTAFPGAESTRFDDVRDGAEKTIFLTEVRGSGINWLEPRDLPLGLLTLAGRLNHSSGNNAYAAFLDGSVRTLHRATLTDAELWALATIAGGELIDPDDY